MNRIFISFSGGKTSAYMAKRIIEEYKDKAEIVTVFANTGQEHEKTLEFVNKCDKEFGLNVVWIESLIHHNKRKSSTFKVTNFNNATRNGSLFEDMIKKYGIPNMTFPHCTRELKTNPLHSYVKQKWKVGTYHTAIGIRADEIDRINENYEKLKLWYPLANWGVTKKDINEFWLKQSFNLEIPEHLGNCTWCWKKSNKKLMKLVNECPEIFKVPDYLERTYPTTIKNNNVFNDQTFFRGNKSVKDLFNLADQQSDLFQDEEWSNCKESCEAF